MYDIMGDIYGDAEELKALLADMVSSFLSKIHAWKAATD
jgi:hypothetical protein